jgi:hypothetical protein
MLASAPKVQSILVDSGRCNNVAFPVTSEIVWRRIVRQSKIKSVDGSGNSKIEKILKVEN